MNDLHKTVEEHSLAIARISEKQNDQDRRLEEHADVLEGLKQSEAVIFERLGMTATKEDINSLRNHVSDSINGLLRDALNAMPQWASVQVSKKSNFWFAVAGIGSIALVAVGVATLVIEHVK